MLYVNVGIDPGITILTAFGSNNSAKAYCSGFEVVKLPPKSVF